MENLEETMKDKEDEVTAMKIKLSSVSANQNSVDNLVDGLQDSLNSKEKQIERFVTGGNASLLMCALLC